MNKSLLLAGVLTMTSIAYAQEKEEGKEEMVPAAEVPRAVTDAIKKKYPSGNATSFEKESRLGVVKYEAALEIKDGKGMRRLDVSFSADGVFRGEEEKVAFAAVPELVKKGFQASKYKANKVEQAEREQKADAAAASWELVTRDGADLVEIVFDDAGKLVKEKRLTKEQVAEWKKQNP